MHWETEGNNIRIMVVRHGQSNRFQKIPDMSHMTVQSDQSKSSPDCVTFFFFFRVISYSLGCGASCDSSDILA